MGSVYVIFPPYEVSRKCFTIVPIPEECITYFLLHAL